MTYEGISIVQERYMSARRYLLCHFGLISNWCCEVIFIAAAMRAYKTSIKTPSLVNVSVFQFVLPVCLLHLPPVIAVPTNLPQIYIHTDIQMHTLTYTDTEHADTNTHAETNTYTQTCACTHAHTHVFSHALTYTRTDTDTHTY